MNNSTVICAAHLSRLVLRGGKVGQLFALLVGRPGAVLPQIETGPRYSGQFPRLLRCVKEKFPRSTFEKKTYHMLAIEHSGPYIRSITDNDEIGRQWLRDATALPP